MCITEQFIMIGGNAVGVSAASKARRDAPDTDVIVFELVHSTIFYSEAECFHSIK
jgi:hypothetical protein